MKTKCVPECSIVHYACSFRPPINIVKALVELHAESVFLLNENGWNPLHVACHHGASVDVIQYLLKKNPGAVRQIDVYGKTALHLVFRKGQRKNVFEMAHIVRLISSTYPTAATLDDSKGISAMELAILKKVDFLFITIMNHAIKKEIEKSRKVDSEQKMNKISGSDLFTRRRQSILTART